MRQLATAVDGVALEIDPNLMLREDGSVVLWAPIHRTINAVEYLRRAAWERQTERVNLLKSTNPNHGNGHLDACNLDPWKPIQWGTYP